ncbi:uncharacterized protein DS421_14g448590 [Arachis hypogaea]|nr:uncharacterized protein DS421_14g448590 [Arachis hypogaea]
MIQLARAYDVETDTLIVDVRNIRINAELIGRALGIPYSDPSKFNWAQKTFKRLGKAIETHQNKKLETCGCCMFALMLLYFQRLRHGPLERCREPEPWLTTWTASELEKKATNVIDEKRGQKFVRNQNFEPGRRVQNTPLKKRAERENAGLERFIRGGFYSLFPGSKFGSSRTFALFPMGP